MSADSRSRAATPRLGRDGAAAGALAKEALRGPPLTSRTPTPLQWWDGAGALVKEEAVRGPPLSSRTPTPLQWAREHCLRSPSPALTNDGGSRCASASASRPGTGGPSAQTGQPLPPPGHPGPRGRSRSVSQSHGTVLSREPSPGLASLVPRRPSPAQDDLLLSKSQPPPSYPLMVPRTLPTRLPKGRFPPERRFLGGGFPRRLPLATGFPARISVPRVRPHNAWCTFVEWTPPDGFEHPSFSFELTYRRVDTGERTEMSDLGQEPEVQLTELEAGVSYCFQVRGRNAFGEGPWSHWSEPYLVPIPQDGPRGGPLSRALGRGSAPPPRPQTHCDSPDQVVLQWEEPCGHGAQILGYRVEYGTDPDDASTLEVTTVTDGSTSLVLRDLAPNRTYRFRVSAVSEAGESEWSAWTEALATKAVPPGRVPPPQLLEASGHALLISWEEPATGGFEVVNYDVRVAQEDETMDSAMLLHGARCDVPERKLHIRDLEANRAYYFQVRAETAMGVSAWSDVSAPCRTLAELPGKCRDLKVVGNVAGEVTLAWKVPYSSGLPLLEFVIRWFDSHLKHIEKGRQQVPAVAGLQKDDVCRGSVTAIHPGARLHFEVAAKSEVGLGPFSVCTPEVVTAPKPPSRPPPPDCSMRTGRSIVVSVLDTTEDNGSPITKYEIKYAMTPDMYKATSCSGAMRVVKPAADGQPRLFEQPVTGFLDRQGPYYFCVRAFNAAGVSPWSEPSTAQMLKTGEPAKMSAPTLAAHAGPTAMLISYTPPADMGTKVGGGLVEYEIQHTRWPLTTTYRREDQQQDAQGVDIDWTSRAKVRSQRFWAAPEGTPSQVLVEGLLPGGRRYVFRVRAFSDSGVSDWSYQSDPFATLPGAPDRPKPPTAAPCEDSPFVAQVEMELPQGNGAPVTECQLQYLRVDVPQVEWQELAVLGPSYCEVSQFPRQPQEGIDLLETSVQVWDYTVLHLEPGAAYRFMFRCKNPVGESAWSEPSSTITMLPHVPGKCTPPFLKSSRDQSSSSLVVHWEPPYGNGAEVTHYTVHWAANPRFQNTQIVEDIREPCLLVDKLQPNRMHYFKVAAWNSAGCGAFSDCDPQTEAGCAHTIPGLPGPPTDLKAKAVERVPGAVYLTWDRPLTDGGANIIGYKVFYSESADLVGAETLTFRGIRECKITDLHPDTTYYFDVLAFNSAGDGPFARKGTSTHTNAVPPTVYVLPRRPAPPTLRLLKGGTELAVFWTCPEEHDGDEGFIYNELTQTHPILTYTVRVTGCYPDRHTPDQEMESEPIKQLRGPRKRPLDARNKTTFHELRGARYYTACVQAFNEAGASGWSDPSAMLRSPANKPDPALDLRLESCTPCSLRIDWACPPSNGEDVTHFLLTWDEHEVLPGWNGGQPAAADEATTGQVQPPPGKGRRRLSVDECRLVARTHRWQIGELQPASYYNLSLVASNIVGDSPVATLGPVRTAPVKPGAPGAPHGTAATHTSVTFSWKPPTYLGGEDILCYQLRWLVVCPGLPVPDDLAPYITDEMRWGHQRGEGPLPAGLHGFLLGWSGAETAQVEGNREEYCVEGLHTGDFLLPVVRAGNRVGFGPWSSLPRSCAAIQDLTTLPSVPAPLIVPPRLERDESSDHRPYSLTAHWTCPDVRGHPARSFILRFQQVDAVDGGDDVQEFSVLHEGSKDLDQGEPLSVSSVHTSLKPGAHYTFQVRAASDLGEAEDWGVPSEPALTPPDLPLVPDPPANPWQWPLALELSWTDPATRGSPLDRCRLRYSASPSMKDKIEVSREVANERFSERLVKVESLDLASGYYFQLRVRNAVGWSPWSAVSPQYVTQASRPAAPSRPVAEAVEWYFAGVSWLRPADHGAPIEEYEVMMVEEEHVARLPQLLEDANACETEEEHDLLVKRFQPKYWRRVGEGAQAKRIEETFHGLLGCSRYAVAVRAFNHVGSSDWSPILAFNTPSDKPAQCPLPVLLEATSSSLRCEFQLPFDNGERIEEVELLWQRVQGPIDRHLAMGGVSHLRPKASAGHVLVALPPPGLERAPRSGLGGKGQALIEDLEAGAAYDVQVRACNALGYGAASPSVRMLCAPGRPDAPEGLRHVNHTGPAMGSMAPSGGVQRLG